MERSDEREGASKGIDWNRADYIIRTPYLVVVVVVVRYLEVLPGFGVCLGTSVIGGGLCSLCLVLH